MSSVVSEGLVWGMAGFLRVELVGSRCFRTTILDVVLSIQRYLWDRRRDSEEELTTVKACRMENR